MIARGNHNTSHSAASRPIALIRRRDITVKPIVLRGKRYWHLKDPLSLRYWQFGEEEFFLWQQLDGNISLSTWQAEFQDRFLQCRIETHQLQGFLGMLHREGLVYSDAVGQADTMLERREQLDRNQSFATWTNLLAIRFRGIDPEAFLTELYPVIRRLFRPFTLGLSVLLIFSAVALVLLRWPEFVARLPSATELLNVQNLGWFAFALAASKILHELGHALTNKHFGGECRELGVMLLVFTPCLYCNVSDTWLIPDKWKRIAVSAAGMYVDLVLAALCTWLWWFSAPGLFHSLCFGVMVVGSMGTLLVNGNPLLRYDGYFVLSDWLEIPNLKSEADEQLRRFTFQSRMGPVRKARDLSFSRRAGLLGYAVASNAYRLCVFGLILWFLYQWFAVRRLEGIALVVVSCLTAAALLPMAWQLTRSWNRPRRSSDTTHFAWIRWAVVAAAAGCAFFIPWPRNVTAPVTTAPQNAAAVYVSIPGILVSHVRPGTAVKAGDQLARLENNELEFQITQLVCQRDQLRKNCELLMQQQIQDTRVGVASARALLPIAQKSLQDVEQQLAQRFQDRNQLELRAPCDGVFFTPRMKSLSTTPDELPSWEGTPLASSNVGCFFEAGVLVGYVATAPRSEAFVMLDQASVGDIQIGNAAHIQLNETPGRRMVGRVTGVSVSTTDDLPPELASKGWFPLSDSENQQLRRDDYYQARILFDDAPLTPWGSSGWAKIKVAPRSLYARARDSLRRTFRVL